MRRDSYSDSPLGEAVVFVTPVIFILSIIIIISIIHTYTYIVIIIIINIVIIEVKLPGYHLHHSPYFLAGNTHRNDIKSVQAFRGSHWVSGNGLYFCQDCLLMQEASFKSVFPCVRLHICPSVTLSLQICKMQKKH